MIFDTWVVLWRLEGKKNRPTADSKCVIKAVDWVFRIPLRRDFVSGSTALFSTAGALRAPVFYRLWW